MRTLYNIATYGASAFLWAAQFFNKKLQFFVQGRKQTFDILSQKIQPKSTTIWFHCASLGEYEQGVPIMEAIKKQFPQHQLLVSFFSPSGFENKKEGSLADVTVYLPMDTKKNVARFINVIRPVLAVFVRYEFWPNYLFELKKQQVPTLLVSGLFRKEQIFFKYHGKFMRKALKCFDHIFVQEKASKKILSEISIKNTTVSGDTRFDRVSQQIEQDNTLDFIDAFKGDSTCLVCGSTWSEDEAVLLPFLNAAKNDIKFIVAPHHIDTSKIESFRKKLTKSSVLFTEKEGKDLSQFSVLIIDTIGLLTKIYSYADIAYVGGAMGSTGLHNILEPATFGIPIVIGKTFDGFPEANRLQQLAGLYSIATPEECSQILQKLLADTSLREKTGMIAGHFINSNTGATRMVMDYIDGLGITDGQFTNNIVIP